MQSVNPGARSGCSWKVGALRGMVEASPTKVPFIALTETWLKNEIEDRQVALGDEYVIHRRDRATRRGGGVMLYLHHSMPAEDVVVLDNDYCQLLLCKIPSVKWVIGVLYRAPSAPTSSFKACLDTTEKYIQGLDDHVVTLMGDFNVPGILWDPPRTIAATPTTTEEALLQFAEGTLMSQYVDGPTRGKNVLDLFFSNSSRLVADVQARDTEMSDHRIVEILLTYDPCLRQSKAGTPTFSENDFRSLDMKKADFEKISEVIDEQDWEAVYEETGDEGFPERFRQIIYGAAMNHAPRKKTVTKKTSRLKTLSRKKRAVRDKLERVLAKGNAPEEQVTALECRLGDLHWEIRNEVVESRRKSERAAIEKIHESSKTFYSYAKRFAGNDGRIAVLSDKNGDLHTEPEEIVELLADQFEAVFSQPRENTEVEEIEACNWNQDEEELRFSQQDLADALKEIKKDAAAGPDGVPADLLRACAKSVSRPLYLMWERSLQSGKVPAMYKESIIVPLYKKGSRAKAENYRPISLTDHVGKAFERVIRKKLVNYFEARGLFKDIQHGFRRKRSTLTQLLHHFDEVFNNYLEGADTDSIYLDYAKAFDKVDHGILLRKLERYGVHEKLVKWIGDFLSDRKQRVVVNGVKSRAVWVRSGVIQGSVLGPILFIIFINDIADVVKGSSVRCFADDSRLIKTVKGEDDVEALQKDLDAVIAWSEKNNMSLHRDKFELMTHRGMKISAAENEALETMKELPLAELVFRYETDAGLIDPENDLRDLGVRVSADMRWKEHIGRIAESGRKKAAWVLSVFETREKLPMLTLYKSLVRSLLEYACPLWNPSSVTDIQTLEAVQRSYTKRIEGVKNLSYYDRLKKLDLMSLQRRRERYIAIHMWKLYHSEVSNDLNIQFKDKGRTGIKAVVPSLTSGAVARQSTFDRSFSVMGPRLWNTLPAEINRLEKFDSFKRALTNFFKALPDEPPVRGYPRRNANSVLDWLRERSETRAVARGDDPGSVGEQQ